MRPTDLLLAGVAIAVAASAIAAAPSSEPPPMKLLVTVVIDGVSWPRLEQARPLLVGGLKRLLDEGHVFTRSNYRHLNTETSPGHAALSTGAPPRVTGVVGNRWFVRAVDGTTRVVSSIEQPGPPAVPGQPPLFYHEVDKEGRRYVFANARELEMWRRSGEMGRSKALIGGGPGGSTVVFDGDDAEWQFALRNGRPLPDRPPGPAIQGPAALRVPTLGDLLVQARPDSRVVSLSPKDRSAAFLAGRDPRHVVYWYDKTSGRMVTSLAYDTVGITGSTSKAMVDRFNRERGGTQLPGRFGLLWKQLDGTGRLSLSAFDLAPYQIPSLGLGFDHRLDQFPGGYFEALYESGLVDEIVTDLVVTVIGDEGLSLGRRLEADVLNVSLAAHDIVAHAYGTESAEADDAIRRVDRQLGRILTALDERFAPGEVLVALSADHGFSPIPEAPRVGETRTGGRLVTSGRALPTFQARVSRMLAEALCLDPVGAQVLATDTSWNLAFAGPFPQRTVDGPCGPAGREVPRAEMGQAAKRLLVTHFAEEVEDVLLVDEQVGWPTSKTIEMARNVLDVERIGDVLLIPRPHALVHGDPARGSGHGSHHGYDTHVPLIFLGAGFARGASSDPVTPYDLAPTLGAAVGIRLPQATGRSLLPASR